MLPAPSTALLSPKCCGQRVPGGSGVGVGSGVAPTSGGPPKLGAVPPQSIGGNVSIVASAVAELGVVALIGNSISPLSAMPSSRPFGSGLSGVGAAAVPVNAAGASIAVTTPLEVTKCGSNEPTTKVDVAYGATSH